MEFEGSFWLGDVDGLEPSLVSKFSFLLGIYRFSKEQNPYMM